MDPSQVDEAGRLPIRLDAGSDVPLYRQIADVVWVEIVDGTLESGDRLPTIRQLAIELGVHPDTVARAYEELDLLGVVVRRQGEGTFVGLKPSDPETLEGRKHLEMICRTAVRDARAAGFSLDDVIEALSELRLSTRKDTRSP